MNESPSSTVGHDQSPTPHLCAPPTLVAISSVSVSIRVTMSPCCATMVANWEKMDPSSAIVDSIVSIADPRCVIYVSWFPSPPQVSSSRANKYLAQEDLPAPRRVAAACNPAHSVPYLARLARPYPARESRRGLPCLCPFPPARHCWTDTAASLCASVHHRTPEYRDDPDSEETRWICYERAELCVSENA